MTQVEQRQYELVEAESSQRQWNETLQHQDKMNLIVEQLEYNKFKMLNPTLTKDGNQWCCLLGADLQVGIAGFGDTPYLAILDWNGQFYKP
jgi:hypothetical protein